MSTSVSADASRSLSSGSRLWPPAMTFAPSSPAMARQRLVDAARPGVPERRRDHAWPPFAEPLPLWRRRAWIAPQTFCAVYGMSRCRMPSGLSASMTALATAAVLAMQPASPTPLTPSGLTGRRGHGLVELEARQPRRPRQRVVEHRARQQLAVVAVDRALPQRLADALGDAAVELAVDDHRVDLLADVVDRDVAHEVDRARSPRRSRRSRCASRTGRCSSGVSW